MLLRAGESEEQFGTSHVKPTKVLLHKLTNFDSKSSSPVKTEIWQLPFFYGCDFKLTQSYL